ncbi:MAG: hypothetical protein IIB16_12165 [Chloroflexi bacterium]|nr:hypothetical protein [Chloroflexota bacterium]
MFWQVYVLPHRGVKKTGNGSGACVYNGGVIINGCKTTMIYCRPNCPPGRRTRPENRVQFGSFQAAQEAGFRGCKVCKPEVGEYGPWVAKNG